MAKAIEVGDVKVTVVYYGDILNQILVKNRPELKKNSFGFQIIGMFQIILTTNPYKN